MDLYRIPRSEISVRLLLDDGRTLEGDLFVPSTGDSDLERVLGRLNDAHEEFLPLAVGNDRFLLNKTGILSAEIGPPDSEPDALGARVVVARLSLLGGLAVVGKIRIEMPPERSRVLDYMNAAPRFLPVWGDEKVTVVQRRAIISVRAED